MNKNRVKLRILSGILPLLLLSGCTLEKKEDFSSAAVIYPDDVEVQEAYSPIVKPASPEKKESDDRGAAADTDGVADANGSQGNNDPAAYNGITDISLEQVMYGDTKMYAMGDSDYLISEPKRENGNSKKALSNTAKKLAALQKKYPEIPVYTYYINRATDMDWYGNEKIKVFSYADYFEKQLGTKTAITSAQYRLPDAGYYMEQSYKTDFHVNNRGSYQIYKEVYAMLSQDGELSDMLVPAAEDDYDTMLFVGLPNGAELGFDKSQMDVFRTFRFELPEYDSFVEGKKVTIGLEKEYQEGKIVRDVDFAHQFSYYGGQSGIVNFDFHSPQKPNLLLISDSQGCPTRKLLASHFNRTVYLDDQQYRILELGQVIEENDISVIIFMGQGSLFE